MARERARRLLWQVGASASGNASFKYTTDEADKVFSRKQREQYERDGFILVKKLIAQENLDKYRNRLIDICDGKHRIPTMTVMKDIVQTGQSKIGEKMVTKIQDFQDDEVLFSYCRDDNILKYVSAFTGPNIRALHTMLIQKPPQIGKTGRHPLHQDLLYFPVRPADRIVCSWTAMETINDQNGCLVVCPGTHKGELLEHGYPQWEGKVNKAYYGVKHMDSSTSRIHLPMEAGDTVFFHPLLVHGSGWNKTKSNYRKAISGHYASADCHFIEVKGTLQEELANEVEEVAKRRLPAGVTISYEDIWRIKSRLVHGKDGKFAE